MKQSIYYLSVLVGSCLFAGCIAPQVEPQKRTSDTTGNRVVVKVANDLLPVFNQKLGSVRFEEIFSGSRSEINTGYSITRAFLPVGARLAEHTLAASEIIYILGGGGVLNVNGESIILEPGKAVYIPAGATQFTDNNSNKNLVFLTIVSPPYDSSLEKITGTPIRTAVSGEPSREVKLQTGENTRNNVVAAPRADVNTVMKDTIPREKLKEIEQNIDHEISVGKTVSDETKQLISGVPDTAKPVDLKNVQQLSSDEHTISKSSKD